MIPRDPLTDRTQSPDRVAYATGVLLAADDFAAEQAYHRGRLARALAYLEGTGTVAGLGVSVAKPVTTGANKTPRPEDGETVSVNAGLAVDPFGRLVEVRRRACIRLGRWLRAQAPNLRETGFITRGWVMSNRAEAGALSIYPADGPALTEDLATRGWFAVDVFLRFHGCERGKTPAFAGGGYDALDAVAPSRIRDGYELQLLLRQETAPALPPPGPWDGLEGGGTVEDRLAQLRAAIIGQRWTEGTEDDDNFGIRRLPEHAETQDGSEVFLARMAVPAVRGPGADPSPIRDTGDVRLSDARRRIVLGTPALAYLLGL